MSPTVTIRRSLQQSVIVIVLILGVAIMATTFLGGRAPIRRFSQALIDQTSSRLAAQLDGFFKPVSRELETLRHLGLAGLLDLDDPAALNELLGAFLRQYPWVGAAIVADDRGREHMLVREGLRWRARQTLDPGGSQRVEWLEWLGDSSLATEREETLDYDPRGQPWFIGAVLGIRGDEPHWTAAYTLSTTRSPGMTASRAFQAGARVTVVGLDVTLLDISRFTNERAVGDRGAAFVLDQGDRIIGMPRPDFRDERALSAALLKRPDELATPVARDLAAALLSGDEPTAQAQRFVSEGEAWWGQMRPFELSRHRLLYVGVVVPEAEMVGDVFTQRVWIGALTLVAIALALARAGVLASRYSEPIVALVLESERIATGDLTPGEPVATAVDEVRRLARAHEQMRDGVGTLLQMEPELRLARRIQMSTFPKRLPEVPGFDLAAWNEPGDATGADSYDVIGVRGASSAGPIVIDGEHAPRAVLLLADATGHGIGPALSVTQVRSMLRLAVRMVSDLSTIVTLINRQLCQDLTGARFVTAWLGEIDSQTGALHCVSAGQAPILHYHFDRDELEVLNADTLPLGVVDRGDIAIPPPRQLGRGDIYAVVSDGIFEAMNPHDEEFGEQRVQDVIRAHRGASAETILTKIHEQAEAFTEGRHAVDDRTIIVVKRV